MGNASDFLHLIEVRTMDIIGSDILFKGVQAIAYFGSVIYYCFMCWDWITA